MIQLAADHPEERVAWVRQAADEPGISVEDILRTTISEKLDRHAFSFEQAAEYVVDENTELYRRLV